MKLTDTQLVLLSAASQRQDGAVELKGGASHKVIGKLLSEHLIEDTNLPRAPCLVHGPLERKNKVIAITKFSIDTEIGNAASGH
jgi:hypothetical protein